MKIKYVMFMMLTPVLWSACSGASKEDNSELDSLRNIIAMQQEEIEMSNSFVELYNTGMDSLMNSNEMIFGTSESPVTTKQKIKDRLESVNNLLNEQREKVKALQLQLEKNKSAHAKQLREALARMQEQLDAKDAEISELRAQLDSKNIDIAQLRSSVEKLETNVAHLEQTTKAQEEALVVQSDIMNTAYVALGTTKELKEKGLLSGGFLAKKKVNVSGVDETKFEKVDIRNYKVLQIPAKKAKVMSPMPEDSYTITNNGDKTCTLTITDPTRFWSQTSFLIISY